MESVIGKGIELVLEYTVLLVARQLKYVCCYKSCVTEMKDAIRKLESDKEVVDREKTAAMNNGQLIYHKADDWLKEATKAEEDVSSLMTYEESKAKMSCCGSIGAGQIMNPIARHKLGRKATKKKLAIDDLRNDRPQHDDICYAPPPSGIVNPAEPIAKQQTVYDGVFRSFQWEEIVEKIMKALKDDRFNNVTGLHGMGGVGKSTMINEVYDQVKKQCMFDEVLRVEVKVKPEVGRIQGEIASQLGLKFENDLTAIRANLLKERLLKAEKNKRVLIILDDLWEKLDLQEVGIPLGGNDQVQIKLLLTSRKEYLLSDKMGARELFHLNVLSDTDALRMFKFVVGVGAEGVNDDKVTEIALKCSGLPIVIEATANALKNRDPGEWDTILERLDNVNVLDKLKVSYDYLPSDECKNLFLICGICRGPNIQVRDLLKYTFGLRLYNRKDSSTLVATTAKLEKLLSRLKAASMLLKSDDNRYVKIHDHMRELAVSIVEENRPEWAYDVTLRDNSSELPDASELKLLLSCCEGNAVELRGSFLKDMEKLNVLEFTSFHLCVVLSPPSSKTQLDHLRNLRTLCLRNCCLDDISMIGELKGLQILSFQGSNISKLPMQLRELTLLKMLDLSDCVELTHIESNVLGSFIKLEELNMENSFKGWEIDQEYDTPPRNARLIELKKMSFLSNVRIHIPSTSMLPKQGQLFSSKLSMYQIMLGYVDYHPNFRDQYIKFSRVLILALDDSSDIIWHDWVQTTLHTADALYLSGLLYGKYQSFSEICTKGFDCLKDLQMIHCPAFQFIISSNDSSLAYLESLFIDNFECLEKLCGGLHRREEAFSKLRVIKVYNCKKLTHLFDFSLLKRRLSSQLEEISVKRCPEMKCIVDGEGDNNYDVVTLSNLQKLEFKYLPKLSSFYGGPSSSNVLFTGKKVAFPCLESLIIDGLDELEHIWDPTDAPAELGKLRLLRVEGCDKLVRVINSNVLMRLQQDLESLTIEYCRSMKEVFYVDDGIINTDDDQHLVLFSRLKGFRLVQIMGLEGIYNNNKNLIMMTIFPYIESLVVWNCHQLRYVLCCSLSTAKGYENLKQIEIGDCRRMEAIVVADDATATGHNDVVTYSYSSLETISVSGCQQLRTLCQYLSSQQDSVVDDFPFFSQKEIFPCLESLDFNGLSKLGKIWPHEIPSDQNSFKMLKHVEIYHCRELAVVFPSTLVPHLENLTELKVQGCEELMQIVHGGVGGSSNSRVDAEESMKMMFTFPCLKQLLLSGLPKLDRFYSSSASSCGFQFPSLENLYIFKCRGVKTLFGDDSDTDMVGALFRSCDMQLAIPNLKSIFLDCLEELTKIWKGEKHQGLILKLEYLRLDHCTFSCTNLESLLSVGVAASLSSWNVLTELTVNFCDGLEYLFTPIGATSLVHLTRLSIGFCNDIKEVIVAIEDEEAADEENQRRVIIRRDDDHIPAEMITFGHLKELQLGWLPKLEKFSGVDNMVINFPSLEKLNIRDCPNMTTFSSGIATASSSQKFEDLNSFVQKMGLGVWEW